MKTILLSALLLISLSAFSQGKITLGNDSLHLIVDGSNGLPIPQAGGWDDLSMQLMGGTSAGSMTLQTTIVGAAIGNPAFADGRMASYLVVLNGVGAGVTGYLQLLFYPTAYGSYQNAVANGAVRVGSSPIFTVTTGSFAYNSIVLHTSPGNSTWADAPVIVGMPEPTVAALGMLGASLLLIRRRSRKPSLASTGLGLGDTV